MSCATSSPPAAAWTPSARTAGRVPHGAILCGALAVLALACSLRIEQDRFVVLPGVAWRVPDLCGWQHLLGLACPGCGLTRSFIALAQGELARAWQFNPAGPLLFALVLGQIPYRALALWRQARGRPAWPAPAAQWWLLALVLPALVGQWMLRITGVLG